MSPKLLLVFVIAVQSYHICNACRNGSNEVANCLHVYLERDFLSIEAIVYPKKRTGYDSDEHLLLDGPELEDNCIRITEVVECLESLQSTCYFYHEFFPYRHLVTSLRKTIDWVCQDLRGRFRNLLSAFNCIETARLSSSELVTSPCYHSNIPANIWQRIVRMQSSTEICGPLRSHLQCVQETEDFKHCPKAAQPVYKEVNELFLSSWCRNSATNLMWSSSTSIVYLFTVSHLIHRIFA